MPIFEIESWNYKYTSNGEKSDLYENFDFYKFASHKVTAKSDMPISEIESWNYKYTSNGEKSDLYGNFLTFTNLQVTKSQLKATGMVKF